VAKILNAQREVDSMKTRCLVIAGALMLLFAGSAAAQTPIEKGATVFAAQKCSLCHSLDGKGSPKGPLDGIGSKLKAEEIRQWLVSPVEMAAKANATRKPVMKSFATLPKEDLDALVAFIASKKKA
jgi:mono/diheme cytochrome c family protein